MRRWLIRINNAWVARRRVRVAPEHLLLLLPSCLQWSACPHNVVNDVDGCRRCGRCDIAGLVALRDELGFRCHVAKGGREAAAMTRDPDVHAIVASACERELVLGIRCAFPKPVLCVPNQTLHGFCRDTRVDVEEVRRAVISLLDA